MRERRVEGGERERLREKGARGVCARHGLRASTLTRARALREHSRAVPSRAVARQELRPSCSSAPGEPRGDPGDTSGALDLRERERRGESRTVPENLQRGGDMRTYWLHSVWVLGFFLSLFSLQGKERIP